MDTRFLPSPREPYQAAHDKACRDMAQIDPVRAAGLADVEYARQGEEGTFIIPYFGRRYNIAYPSLAVNEEGVEKEVSLATQILLLHYLLTADGTPLAGEWVGFRYLPDGRLYEAAFEGRAPLQASRTFGNDREAFVRAARALGGHELAFGDASYSFRPLPRLALASVLWLGDEEMPGSVKILFDAAAGHYLPTEDLSAVGGTLGGLLLRFAK
ncbi:MAG: DUF3786 domain-containing protein [Chloroflexota bacterium]